MFTPTHSLDLYSRIEARIECGSHQELSYMELAILPSVRDHRWLDWERAAGTLESDDAG